MEGNRKTNGKGSVKQCIYGRNVVKQVLQDPSRVHRVWLSGDDREIEELCRTGGVPLQKISRKELTKLCRSEHHNGTAAEIDAYRLYTVDDLVREKKGQYGLVVLLDGLEDPHNLGAVLRTCDAIGADGVIIRKDRAAGLTAGAAKASVGAIDTVKCASVTNLVRTVQDLKKKGYWIIGTDMDGQDYRSLKYDFHAVLIIGNEGKGISRLLREECDYVVSLPMIGTVESLNASVSAGIMLYEIYSQRFPL